MNAYEKVRTARSSDRPTALAYINNIFSSFIEFHGDRRAKDDGAIVSGIASLNGMPVTVIAIEKGRTASERTMRNFGSASPEGYRKALRLMKQAEKFGRPVITFVDTSGAFCGIEAEERGEGEAIAVNLMEMMDLNVPILSVLIGEGGSGGALALAVADRVWMLENAVYSVISPEGCASILFKDSKKAKEAAECLKRKRTMLRRTDYDDVPMKPQRVYQEMNNFFGKDVHYVTAIGLSQIGAAQHLKVQQPRGWINCGQAGPLGWTIPAALGVRAALPDADIVALSGDFDFQFMIEELAVGAHFKLPYIHIVVNNSYLGLIRQGQLGFNNLDYCVQLSFDNINSPEVEGYGIDFVKVAEGLGCKAIRVHKPDELIPAFKKARELMKEFQVPVVVEAILERVTNIPMGGNLDQINEFGGALDVNE